MEPRIPELRFTDYTQGPPGKREAFTAKRRTMTPDPNVLLAASRSDHPVAGGALRDPTRENCRL
jgi:hypothetical protein